MTTVMSCSLHPNKPSTRWSPICPYAHLQRQTLGSAHAAKALGGILRDAASGTTKTFTVKELLPPQLSVHPTHHVYETSEQQGTRGWFQPAEICGHPQFPKARQMLKPCLKCLETANKYSECWSARSCLSDGWPGITDNLLQAYCTGKQLSDYLKKNHPESYRPSQKCLG